MRTYHKSTHFSIALIGKCNSPTGQKWWFTTIQCCEGVLTGLPTLVGQVSWASYEWRGKRAKWTLPTCNEWPKTAKGLTFMAGDTLNYAVQVVHVWLTCFFAANMPVSTWMRSHVAHRTGYNFLLASKEAVSHVTHSSNQRCGAIVLSQVVAWVRTSGLVMARKSESLPGIRDDGDCVSTTIWKAESHKTGLSDT